MKNFNWKKEILTVPNLLSLIRLVMIPVYITIYLNATEVKDYYIAAVILALSCLTDMIDGKIARRFNMITTVGKFLDPLADKLTQFSVTLCLSLRYPVLRPVLVLFVVKEGFQLIAVLLHFRKGKILSKVLMAGKVCTTVLFVSLILLVLMPNIGQTAVDVIAVVDSIFLIIAFVSYFFAFFGKNPKIEDLQQMQ